MIHNNVARVQLVHSQINKSVLDTVINEDVLREIFNHVNFTTRFKLSLADKCCFEIRKKTIDQTCVKLYTLARSSMLKKLEEFSEDSKEFVTLFDKFIESEPLTFSYYFQKLLTRNHVRSIDLKILRRHLNEYIPSKEDLLRVLDAKIETRNRSISDDKGEYQHAEEFYEMGLIFANLGNFEEAYKCAAVMTVHHFDTPYITRMLGGMVAEICLNHVRRNIDSVSIILSESQFFIVLGEISKHIRNYTDSPIDFDCKYIKSEFLKHIVSSLPIFEYELAKRIIEIIDSLTEDKEIMIEGYTSLGIFDKAIEYYKIHSDPDNNYYLLKFYYRIAKQINICNQQHGNVINRIKEDLQMVQLNSKTINSRCGLALRILLKFGEEDAAEKLLDQMKQMESQKIHLPGVMVRLACSYRDTGKIDKCINYLENATQLFGGYKTLTKDSTDAFDQGLKSAECYISAGKVKEAADILNMLDPKLLKENHILKLFKFTKLSITINPQTGSGEILKLFDLKSIEHTLLIFKLSQWAIKTKFKTV